MSWFDAAKDVAKLAQKLDNIEDQRKLIEVSDSAVRLQAENQELRDRIAKLEEALAFKGDLTGEATPFGTATMMVPTVYTAGTPIGG